ncbi:hypothetical protein DFH11DRAFT_1568265 [Phellopilus nigrolimitatus]|nr:hypothetical protein DFH11DRAFT_1568265 [Phellopilus nigrolimitatus]
MTSPFSRLQVCLVLEAEWVQVRAEQQLGKLTQATDNVTSAPMPNMTTFRNSNLAFLFPTLHLSSNKLCVACTHSIMSAYIAFEQSAPHAPCFPNSLILSGQPALYSAVKSACGTNFMNGAIQAAGGISDGLISGAAPRVSRGKPFNCSSSSYPRPRHLP